MSISARLWAAVIALALLGAMTGCQTTRATQESDGPALPAAQQDGGLLLKTGSIMLGPGVGRNAWRWQGDGQWGF